ncbi:MAG TPA: SDR family NAD(P)-dependent oxidoreductase [Bryobacteraceae bacterium]|nr:SDR family NAD(P)-dependent oxidoreductase [Bryobacteraceae bacterium]
MEQLNNKVVLITGFKGGLGTFVTRAFLEAGARVVGVSRTTEGSDPHRERFSAIAADLLIGENARGLIEAVAAQWGRIDGLVHLIGGFAGGESIAETDDATLDRMLDLNLRSAFRVIRAVLPKMREQNFGRIIAIGSKAALEPSPLAGAYAASKAALVSLIRTAARENRDKHIAANVLLPGTMDTPANRAAMPDADFSEWVDPCQVARLAVHLMSDAASQISGTAIAVDGGA